MDKIWAILSREFLVRVRKRSFLISTILAPLIFPAILGLFLYFSVSEDLKEGPELVLVADTTGLMNVPDGKQFRFRRVASTLEVAREIFRQSEAFALLYVPGVELSGENKFVLYTRKRATAEMRSSLEDALDGHLRELKLKEWRLDETKLQALKTGVRLREVHVGDDGEEEESNSTILSAVGAVLGILIYLMVTLYGVQTMHGVIEEKSSRVVEVLMSSVRPFQLMMGKILGIGAVGILQFLIWIVLITSLTSAVSNSFQDRTTRQMTVAEEVVSDADADSLEDPTAMDAAPMKLLENLRQLPLAWYAAVFVFYFLGGYFLYGALFAAVGAGSESVQDAQQFQFPLTFPLLGGYLGLFSFILRDPHSTVSFWLSVIPFTSPICMVARMAFGVPWYELALSMALLVLGFLGTTWVAGRIYRVGILMTGTRPSWRTLLDWARRSD